MTTFLITGAAGLIGSRLVTWILDNVSDSKVIGIDDLSGGFIENVDSRIRYSVSDRGYFSVVDLTEREPSVDDDKIDYVFHLAAYAAEGLSPFIRTYNYKNNLITTANIINFCIRNEVKRLVFTSSMAVYGKNQTPFHEDITPAPIDPYGIAKYAAEMDIKVAGQQHELDWCIIRPHNVYGRNQNIWDSYRNVVGIAIYKGLVGDPITVYGDGLQTRAFSYIDDSLECLYNAAVNENCSKQIINLGGIKESTILNVANIVGELSGVSIIHLPPRHEVRHAHSTWQKSVDLLGFKHKTELYDGIKNMWEWARKQPKRERFIWPEYELNVNIYPYWKPETLEDGYYTNDLQTKLP